MIHDRKFRNRNAYLFCWNYARLLSEKNTKNSVRQEEQLYLARSCFDSCSRYFWRIFGAGEIHATHTHTHSHQEKERTMTTKQHRKKRTPQQTIIATTTTTTPPQSIHKNNRNDCGAETT